MLYAGEGESRKPDENSGHLVLGEPGEKDKVASIVMKGHEFVAISFHMPASCESCTKPLWAPFRPPPAVECRRKLQLFTWDGIHCFLTFKLLTTELLDAVAPLVTYPPLAYSTPLPNPPLW